MRALIIGGSGFVGAYLIRHLKELGQEVAVTKMPGERLERSDSDGIQVLDLDILDEQAVWQALASVQPDTVYHLAAQSSVAVSWERPQLTADVNIAGVCRVGFLQADSSDRGWKQRGGNQNRQSGGET